MKSPAERGPIGAWAQEARDDAGLSVPEVIVRLAGRGHAATEATIRGIEGGSKRPGRRLLRLLGDIYGRSVPGEPLEPTEPADALVSALLAQTEAINALVGRLDVLTAGQATSAGEMMRALGILGARLVPRGKRVGDAPGVPDSTARS